MTGLDGATDVGDLNARSATPGEFAARWNAATPGQRDRWLQQWTEATLVYDTVVGRREATLRELGDNGLRIAVEIPVRAGLDVFERMIDAVAQAVHAAEPTDRDGWDVNVYAEPADALDGLQRVRINTEVCRG